MSSQALIGEDEPQDSPLRRFHKMAQTNGILREAKAHRFSIQGICGAFKSEKER
jgi:ribosomal protein S21